ncbi:MAG: hypothetical protein HN936_14415 [Bacteroidetes bacterium]|nr:hypothetical protein [Bacteroidota bacterium]
METLHVKAGKNFISYSIANLWSDLISSFATYLTLITTASCLANSDLSDFGIDTSHALSFFLALSFLPDANKVKLSLPDN